jgi:hypothetical protein
MSIIPARTTARLRHVGITLLIAVSTLMTVLFGLGAPAQAATSNTLWRGGTLQAEQALVSDQGNFTLRMQGDGNLVAFGSSGVVWASGTNGSGANRAVLQSDGNLVLYTGSGRAVFATGTAGTTADALVMQSDGNLVLYGAGRAFWASESKAEHAIEWFRARTGSRAFEGKCELAVESAFGTSGRYASAKSHWNGRSADQRRPHTAAPRGSLVFYNTSVHGHVAISLGNGMVASTSVNGKIGTAGISYFQNPLGWATSPW